MKQYGMDSSPGISPQEYQQPKRFVVSFFILLAILFVFGTTRAIKQLTGPRMSPTPIPYTTSSPQSQSPTSPAPIETIVYNNPTLPLSFRYPASYGPPVEQDNYISITSPLKTDLGKIHNLQDGELKMEFVFTDAKSQDTVSSFVADNKSTFSGTVKSEQKTTVAGEDAVEWTWEGEGTGKTYFLIHDDKRIMIMKYPAETSRNNECDGILSSLSFTPSTGASPAGYACPQENTVDCMPTVGGPRKASCEPAFLKWATDNCPGFSVAY